MRYWYINKKREKVFKPVNLIVLACLATVILVAIQPKTGAFRDMLGSMRPDVVALNYARVLVALSPEDAELKTLLAQQYANLGRYAEADAVLIGIRGVPVIDESDNALNRAKTLLHLSVLQQRLYASTSKQQQLTLQKRVVELLRVFDTTRLVQTDRVQVADVALAFGQPLIAAQIFDGLFRETGETRWALEAGEQFEAANLPALAASAYARASIITGEHREQAIEHALRLYLAAGEFTDGIRYLSYFDPVELSYKTQENAVYFALSADAPNLAGTYAKLLTAGDRDLSNPVERRASFDDLVNAALAVEDLDTAKHWAERAAQSSPNDSRLRKQLAQVLEWRGEVEQSLDHWVWLARHDAKNAQIERTWQLAKSVYRQDYVADLLNSKSRAARLSPEEIDAWLEAQMALHALGPTIVRVRDYVTRNPDDEYAWKAGAKLLDNNESLVEALAWWRDIEARYPLSSEDQRAIAAIHWRRFDLPSALAALEKVDTETVTYNAPYWRDVGELAYQTGRTKLAHTALSRLAAFDELTANEYDMLFETMAADASNDRRYHASKAWELTGALRFLLKAMEAEFDVDAARFERLLRVADDRFDALKGNPLYWTLKGQHLARRGQPAEAETSFLHALTLAPSYAPAVSGYAWLLVEQRKLTGLWQLLDGRPELALEKPELAAPFAAGYMLLARYDEAAFWYRRAIAAAPNDMYLALEYSVALMKTGRVDEATHWRRETLVKALAKMPALDGLDVSALRSLSSGMLSRPQFERLVHALNEDDLRPVIRTLINDQLDQQQWDAARYWVAYAEQNDIQLDDYPKFMVAHQGRDMRALAPFKFHTRPTMRAEAQLASREDAAALITALRQINTRTPEGDRLMLTRMAADISVNRPSGVKAGFDTRDFGSLSTTSAHIDVARTLNTMTLSASAVSTDHRIDRAFVTSNKIRFSESSATARIARTTETGSWEAAVGTVRSPTGMLIPASLTGRRQWDQTQSSVARISVDQRPDETPLLRAYGKKHSLTLGHTWQPTARDTLSAQGAAEWFADRAGERLSKGYRLELGWQHAVFFERPAVIARAAITAARRSLVNKTKSLAQQITDLAFGDLLPERTDRIGIGLTFSHGEPGRMNWQVPSPRYRLDFDVGYQLPDNKPTYEISASAGIRLFGDDELALTLSYASRPDLGIQASGYAVGLMYNYRLGR